MTERERYRQHCIQLKETGYSPKATLPINIILEAFEKADKYDAMPATIKDAAEALRAGQ